MFVASAAIEAPAASSVTESAATAATAGSSGHERMPIVLMRTDLTTTETAFVSVSFPQLSLSTSKLRLLPSLMLLLFMVMIVVMKRFCNPAVALGMCLRTYGLLL